MDLLPTHRKSAKLVSFVFVLVLTIVGLQSLLQLNQLKIIVDQLITNNKLIAPSNRDNLLTIDVDLMTPEQVLDYFQFPNHPSCQLVHDFGGKMLKNPSGLDGQKAVCLEPTQLAPPVNNCLVYSFGINNEWSFDEAMADYGCQVYAFDPSMVMDDHDHTPAIHFFNIGLGYKNMVSDDGWHILTLSSIYNKLKLRHGNVVIDYLKMDIEYSEWEAIPQIIQSGIMGKVRQLAMEVHLHPFETLEELRDRVRTLRSLEDLGMIRFDAKRNPWTGAYYNILGQSRSAAFEIAWYNQKFLEELPSNSMHFTEITN